MNRRLFLIAALSLALVAPSHAFLRGGSGAVAPAVFQGDPTAAVTPLTIAGSITPSRTSCQTPCFIQVSASAITATGASVPYQQADVTFDFGDPTGTETITDPFSGQTVNLNNQVQPEAAYVYRNVGTGTYTITMTVRFCTSGNCSSPATATYDQKSFTQNIAVTAFSPGGDFFYSAAGSGTTCSIGSPCAITQFASKLGNNTRHNFNKGDTFNTSTGLDLAFGNANLSGVRVTSYGSGAKPIINLNSGTPTAAISITAGHTNEVKSDIVFSGLEVDVSGTASPTQAAGISATTANGNAATGNTIQDLYFDNVDVPILIDLSGSRNVRIITQGGCAPSCPDVIQHTGLWMGTLSSPLSAITTGIGFLGGPYNWHFNYGMTISGSGVPDPTRNHHTYHHMQTHLAYSYGTFGCSDPTCLSPTRNYNVKWAFDPPDDGPAGSPAFGQFAAITHNSMTGTQRPTNLGQNNNDPTVSRIKDVVYSKNVKQGFTGEDDPFNGDTVTWRDEDICNNGTVTINSVLQIAPTSGTTSYLKARIYRERIYNTTAVTNFDFLPASFTWTVPEVFADNLMHNTSASASVISTTFSQQVSAGTVSARNSWYCPNKASGACFSNNGSAQTLAQWQSAGLGANDNQTNPNFPAPASCNLGPRLP